MDMHFQLSDNYDDPCDPDEWSYVSGPVAGRWTTLDEALRAATLRALQLADDPCSEVYSVDVTMYQDGGGSGMTVASLHVWFDHGSTLPWLPGLRSHLGAGQHTVTPGACSGRRCGQG